MGALHSTLAQGDVVFWMRAETRGRERSGGYGPPERTPAACCEGPLRASGAPPRSSKGSLNSRPHPKNHVGGAPERHWKVPRSTLGVVMRCFISEFSLGDGSCLWISHGLQILDLSYGEGAPFFRTFLQGMAKWTHFDHALVG